MWVQVLNDRIDRIRENEKKSHTEIYQKETLYSSNTWLGKTIKTVKELVPYFEDYEIIRALDLGAGVGRNSIFLAEQFRDKDCRIDCVDLLDIAIDKLKQNAAVHSVDNSINGITQSIEDYIIAPDSNDLIMAVSALEHVDSEESFVSKLKEIEEGIRDHGIVCLIINSEINEINIETSQELEPQFEVNISTEKMKNMLSDVFKNWTVIKESIVNQKYEIPRDGITSRLTTNVVTFVAQR